MTEADKENETNKKDEYVEAKGEEALASHSADEEEQSEASSEKGLGEHAKPTMPDLEGLLDGSSEIVDELKEQFEELTREEELEAEVDDLKEKLIRSLAECENIRKRSERDRRDAEKYGGQKLARDLLPIYDNMERALGAIDDDLREKAAAVVEGIELTRNELLSSFAKHKIVVIQPKEGDKFDPQIHQAMFEAPVPNVEPGCIIQVMTVGFKISERLLRPADVGVSS